MLVVATQSLKWPKAFKKSTNKNTKIKLKNVGMNRWQQNWPGWSGFSQTTFCSILTRFINIMGMCDRT